GVDPTILDPRATWADKAAYDRQAGRLIGMFVDNFAKFEDHVDATVADAAPRIQEAAE
ncbi:MAG: phosphoenolpyruvate carboxykinase (ATP), partial [Rhizobiaceae bacterium]